LWLLLFAVLDATAGVIVIGLFSVVALIAAADVDERRTAVVAGAAVATRGRAELPGRGRPEHPHLVPSPARSQSMGIRSERRFVRVYAAYAR
jgi:hypothetical protein